MVDFFNRSSDSFRLVWRGDAPCIAHGEETGDCLSFSFGRSFLDDTEPPDAVFFIILRKREPGWSAELAHGSTTNFEKRPEVEALVAELNTVLPAHKEYDFLRYVGDWKRQDEYFHILLLWMKDLNPQTRQLFGADS